MKSRRGIAAFEHLHQELPKRGVRVVAAHTVKKRRELLRVLRKIVETPRRIVAVVGGDGTQAAAVGVFADKDCMLAVVPGGTGNSFALSLGIPDIDTSIDVIASGRERRIDVGVVNETCFANFATIGLLAETAGHTPRPLKRIFGPVAYGLAALRDIFLAKPFAMHVKWKDGELDLRTHQAIVANGRYFGWQAVTPDADVRSGELAFFSVDGAKLSDAIATNAALLRGDHMRLAGAHYFSARKIEITAKPRQLVNVDGHDAGRTPATFRVMPKALRVLVP